jgi:hypothetical protein
MDRSSRHGMLLLLWSHGSLWLLLPYGRRRNLHLSMLLRMLRLLLSEPSKVSKRILRWLLLLQLLLLRSSRSRRRMLLTLSTELPKVGESTTTWLLLRLLHLHRLLLLLRESRLPVSATRSKVGKASIQWLLLLLHFSGLRLLTGKVGMKHVCLLLWLLRRLLLLMMKL